MGLAISKCNAIASVALLVVSMGLNGAATITNLRNPQDLAPNFAGTQFGIMSFFGGFTGFLVPLILGALTKNHVSLNAYSIFQSFKYCLIGYLANLQINLTNVLKVIIRIITVDQTKQF